MLDFKLLPGDKYDGRCAEIYITEKQFLVYHCSVCDEIYPTFNQLLSHITNDHYKNTKEYSDVETKGLEKLVAQENGRNNQLATKKLPKKLNKYFDDTFPILKKTLVRSVAETTKLNLALESEANSTLHKSSTISAQRKKIRNLSSTLKSPTTGKSKMNTLTRHQCVPNEERDYVCSVCGFAFKEKCNLRRHLLRHSNQKKLSCTVCPKLFFHKVEHRTHEHRHKGERPHLCAHCGMGFVSMGSLTQHIKIQHSTHRSFKCEQCYKTFTNFYQLQEHQPIHGKGRNFQRIGCPVTFKCDNFSKLI